MNTDIFAENYKELREYAYRLTKKKVNDTYFRDNFLADDITQHAWLMYNSFSFKNPDHKKDIGILKRIIYYSYLNHIKKRRNYKNKTSKYPMNIRLDDSFFKEIDVSSLDKHLLYFNIFENTQENNYIADLILSIGDSRFDKCKNIKYNNITLDLLNGFSGREIANKYNLHIETVLKIKRERCKKVKNFLIKNHNSI